MQHFFKQILKSIEIPRIMRIVRTVVNPKKKPLKQLNRQDTPSSGCLAIKEDLLDCDLHLMDFCPNCKKLGVKCLVSNHPTSSGIFDSFTLIYF